MIKNIIWTVVLCTICAILQSVMRNVLPFFPDLALCVLVFSAYVNGTMTGHVSGFFSGLLYSFLSPASPLGLNSLIRTIIGAFTGMFKGSFFLDIIFLPIIICALATLLKAAIIFILHLIIGSTVSNTYSLTTSVLWIELGLNAASGPLLFFLLRNFKPIITERR